MKKLITLTSLLSLLFVLGCAKSPAPEESAEETTDEVVEETTDSNKPDVQTFFQYSNKKYAFAFGFPENWGEVSENGGEADTTVGNVVTDYHWVAEEDDNRRFNLFVVELEGNEAQVELGQTFLASSDEYAFYYTATQPDPVVCAEGYAATADELTQCELDKSIWNDEVQAVIVASFYLTSR